MLRGRPIQHLTLETDGSPSSLRVALDSIRDNAACVVLSGTVGDTLATLALASIGELNIAQAAPWLQTADARIDDRTFPIFAAREQQITYALKVLSIMGLQQLGAVFPSKAHQDAYREEVERIAAGMDLKLQQFYAVSGLRELGQKMTAETPPVLLFMGGTPELADFTQGLEKQTRQRYVVALADVNLLTMVQMGAARNTPVIATQPVPPVNSSLPVVRSYRETLERLFDEPPTSLSLAGFIAARYTHSVLKGVEGALTRSTVLEAFQRRENQDLGGFRITFDAQRRSGQYVTQSMMSPNGRVIW